MLHVFLLTVCIYLRHLRHHSAPISVSPRLMALDYGVLVVVVQ